MRLSYEQILKNDTLWTKLYGCVILPETMDYIRTWNAMTETKILYSSPIQITHKLQTNIFGHHKIYSFRGHFGPSWGLAITEYNNRQHAWITQTNSGT